VPRFLEAEPAVLALTTALARVTALVPYLTATVNRPDDGEPVSGQALIDDPDRLGRIISSTGPSIGTDDPVVAASLYVQGYSYRVLTLTLASLFVAGLVPDASAPRLAIGLSRGWPSLVTFTGPRVLIIDADIAALPTDSSTITDAFRFVVDTAIDAHLRPLLRSVRTGIGVPLGERLLWGNVTASAATAFRTVQGCLGPFVEPLADRFFALAPPEMTGLGSFLVVENGSRRGWFWERTNCCLVDRLPGAVRCADCSLTPAPDRRLAYRESLAPS
jgi:Ferric iron reductase FhuF-like transporter